MKIINKIKKRLRADIDSQGFQYTVSELVNMHQMNQKLSKNFGRILSQDIIQYKKSDTVFILGSGPSINKLDNAFFDHIKQHDTIGFNYWFAHDFVPDFYMFQLPKVNQDPMLNLLHDRQNDYKNVPFILRGSALASSAMEFSDPRLQFIKDQNPFLLSEYPFHSSCSIDIPELIEYISILGLLNHGMVASLVPKWRGTLGLLISLCYQMGYKKIVLCGMDMQDNHHFWNHSEYYEIKAKYNLPESAPIKDMTDRDRSLNTVPKYVYALNNWMQKKSNVEVFVAHTQTVLYPKIRLYEY